MEHRCPQCGKKSVWKGNRYRPFCSGRCRLVDLGAWADEKYRFEENPDETDLVETIIDDERKEGY